jgi:acyl-CoA reductase-like NAD-dependent aldehyde dehydrogenase
VSADLFEWYAEEGKRAYGRVVPSRSGTRRLAVLRQPIGVVGIITAWNFPADNVARAAAALAAGCSIVVRPSESTPLTALDMERGCRPVSPTTPMAKLMRSARRCFDIPRAPRFKVDRDRGFFYSPTLVTDVRPSMRIYEDEIFGPVMPVASFDDVDEAALRQPSATQTCRRKSLRTCSADDLSGELRLRTATPERLPS